MEVKQQVRDLLDELPDDCPLDDVPYHACVLRRLAQLRRKVAGNGGGLDPSQVEQAQAAVEEVASEIGLLVADLEAAGVQVKDLDRGLVDFPARHPESGDLVLLCWHLGEDRVAFWHGLEEGFAGRKPLPF